MPHVASESKTHALNHPLPHGARPTPASDRAAATPFESLLDDSAQGAPERPAQPAADDKASPASQPQPAQPTANAQSGKTDAARSDDAGKAAIDPTAAGDDKAAEAKIAGKLVAKIAAATAGDDSKPASDGKPADDVTPDGLALAPAVDTVQIVTSADAVAAGIAPVSDAIAPAAPATTENAIVAAGTPQAKPDAKPDTKPDALAALQTDADTPKDNAKLPPKASPQLHTDGKPQPAAGDADKDVIANARDEVAAGNHRAAIAEAPAPIGADTSAAPKAGGDAAQPSVLSAPGHSASSSAASAAPAAALAPQAAAIPLAGVAIEIASRALAGKNHFEIRLDPPELGRIEVHLDVDRDGNVTSRLIADRADTLDLLRRDSTGLERALQDAGLKTSDNSLQFSLRDQSMGQQQARAGADIARLVVADETPKPIETTQRLYSRLAGQGSGIDIHV